MGRIFTVAFTFEGRSYTAFVKISNGGDLFSVHIHLPDTTLHHLIPEGNISYNSTTGFQAMRHATPTPALELMSRVIDAIEAHLQHQ
ncbi:hypothetical protein SAMN05444008_112150 [Cnuella takakiae]|uniref:Uncharacterized protein n=1 Tax=Cnuella takakiae TaxID=1302690 RepID=A0A1M5ERK8_9BACT|nr:hypothetical protein [Cnuella takakiae]OLY91269.1 hypothetical protein BUE76_04650 [Cnuella takakiae]SHF81642.1 hypothetical protein SAMN05444008_112150 [Cnuella takakiae]